MSEGLRMVPPRQVPTLTEVVELRRGRDDPPDGAPSPVPPEAEFSEALPDEADRGRDAEAEQIVQRVLIDVQQRIDAMLDERLEQRIQAELTPTLARFTEALVLETRDQLAEVLRDVVAEAVERALDSRRSP